MEENNTVSNIPPNPIKERILSWPLILFMLVMAIYAGAIFLYIQHIAEPPVSAGDVSSKDNLTTQRNNAITEIKSEFSSIENQMGLTSVAKGTGDYCERATTGTNFLNRCAYTITRFYAFDGEFREYALQRENLLLGSLGWKSGSVEKPMEYRITHYYDPYYGPQKPSHVPTYLISWFGATYEKDLYGDAGKPRLPRVGDMRLSLGFADRNETHPDFHTLQRGHGGLIRGATYEEYNLVDVSGVFNSSTEQFLMAIAIKHTYFQD